MIKHHLISTNGECILAEYSACGSLQPASRRKLIRHLGDFIIAKCGIYPSLDEKVMVSKAALELFPIFNVKNSDCGGIVRNFVIVNVVHKLSQVNCHYNCRICSITNKKIAAG